MSFSVILFKHRVVQLALGEYLPYAFVARWGTTNLY